MDDGNPSSFTYYVFIYCSKPDNLELELQEEQSISIYRHELYDNKVNIFSLVSPVSLEGMVFEISVSILSNCTFHKRNPIRINIGRSIFTIYDASHYVTSSPSNPFFHILPALHFMFPQGVNHFVKSMTLMRDYLNFTAELSAFLSCSDTNIMKFLNQFHNRTPPAFIVGLLIVAKCHSEPFTTSKLSKYLILRLKDYLPFLYSQCIFNDTEDMDMNNHEVIKNLYRFILVNCGIGFAGFFIVAASLPVVDFDFVSFLEPASSAITDAEVNIANGELFASMMKEQRGQQIILPGICAALSAMLTMRVQPMAEKLAKDWTEFDFRSMDLDMVALIIWHRLKTASIDYSSQGFFLVLRPLLINYDEFIKAFISSDHWMPFRHLPNFAVVFSISREDVYNLAICALENEEDISNLFITSLGSILIMIEGEKRIDLFTEFMSRTREIAFSIGEQWSEQCTKSVWRGLAESSEELIDTICKAMGNDVCSLAAGYFSASNYPENEKISEILQQCLIQVLPTINPTPKVIGKEFVNVLALMKCEWVITIDPVSLKKIALASKKLVYSVKKKLNVTDKKVLERLQLLDESAKHILSVISTSYPHIS